MIRSAAKAYGEETAIVLEDDGVLRESITIAELDRRSGEIARGLVARGIGKGGRVGFIFGNGPGFALMLAAISRLGAIAVPISTMIRDRKSVVSGTSVSVRVDLGGRRILKTKKNTH